MTQAAFSEKRGKSFLIKQSVYEKKNYSLSKEL